MTNPNINSQTSPHTSSKIYRTYVLVLLTLVYTFNFVDRQILGIIAPALQADMQLSDSQLGILLGFAFALLYTMLGIPIARLADKWNRVSIITISLACWSGFTALSGFAQNFTHLALARIGVGIGEAGGSPPSHSIISDLYPKEQRAGALAIYAMGIPIGITFAYLGGGWIVQNISWRMAFITVGLPGVLLAILLKLTVREPNRGSAEAQSSNDAFQNMDVDTKNSFVREITILWRAARHLLSIRSYRLVVTGLTAGSFASYAIGGFIVLFFERSHPDLSITNVYTWLGIINGTAYVLGVFIGGKLVDKLAKKNLKAYGLVPAIALTLSLPIFIAAMWVQSPVLSLICLWPVHLFPFALFQPPFSFLF